MKEKDSSPENSADGRHSRDHGKARWRGHPSATDQKPCLSKAAQRWFHSESALRAGKNAYCWGITRACLVVRRFAQQQRQSEHKPMKIKSKVAMAEGSGKCGRSPGIKAGARRASTP